MGVKVERLLQLFSERLRLLQEQRAAQAAGDNAAWVAAESALVANRQLIPDASDAAIEEVAEGGGRHLPPELGALWKQIEQVVLQMAKAEPQP